MPCEKPASASLANQSTPPSKRRASVSLGRASAESELPSAAHNSVKVHRVEHFETYVTIHWVPHAEVLRALAPAIGDTPTGDGGRIPIFQPPPWLIPAELYWRRVRDFLLSRADGPPGEAKVVTFFGPSLEGCPPTADGCRPFFNWARKRFDFYGRVVFVQLLTKDGTPMEEVGSVANAVFNLLEATRPNACAKIVTPRYNPPREWMESFIENVCDEVVVLTPSERGNLGFLEDAGFAGKKVFLDSAEALLYEKNIDIAGARTKPKTFR